MQAHLGEPGDGQVVGVETDRALTSPAERQAFALAQVRPADRGLDGHPGSGHGSFHCWLAEPVHGRSAGWVPMPPVLSRHLPVATLTKAGLRDVDSNVGLAVQSVLILLIAWGTVALQGNLGQLGPGVK